MDSDKDTEVFGYPDTHPGHEKLSKMLQKDIEHFSSEKDYSPVRSANSCQIDNIIQEEHSSQITPVHDKLPIKKRSTDGDVDSFRSDESFYAFMET